jgi:hypothetical protein
MFFLFWSNDSFHLHFMQGRHGGRPYDVFERETDFRRAGHRVCLFLVGTVADSTMFLNVKLIFVGQATVPADVLVADPT